MILKKNSGLFAVFILAVFFLSLLSDKNFTDNFIVPKDFYFYFLLSPLLLSAIIAGINTKFRAIWTLSFIDITVLSYFLFCFVRILFTNNLTLNNTEFINLFLLIIFYFIIKLVYQSFSNEESKRHYHILHAGIFILIIINSVYGIFQHFSILPPSHPEFKLGGSFGNPGPYSNFLVIIIPFAFPVLFNRKEHPGYLFNLAALSVILTLFVLPFTNARTAWICFTVVCCFFLIFYLLKKEKIRNFISKKIVLILLSVSLLLLSAAAGYYLVSFKKTSASGRLFIWEVTLNMIAEKPFFGYGFDSYSVKHNDYQAGYFKDHPNEKAKAYLADNSTYAFNEFLQIAAELGITGLILFLLVFFSVFYSNYKPEEKNTYSGHFYYASIGIVISVISASFFSYPLHNLPAQAVFFYALATVSAFGRSRLNLSLNVEKGRIKSVSFIGLVLLFVFYYNQIKRFNSEKEWLKAYNMMRKNDYDRAYRKYSGLYSVMKYNEYFLFNYGAELTLMKRYNESIEMLNQALPRLNDTEVYIYLGHAYEEAGNLREAEKCYLHASDIVPSKFFPKYSLVSLYMKMQKKDEAVKIAKELVDMDIKVKSDIINSIISDMQEFIKTYE